MRSDITDVLYAGYVHENGWQTETEANTAFLGKATAGLIEAGAKLNRVVLMQGQKYYGSHLGPFETPSRKDDPGHFPPNFYYDQQDLLVDARTGKDWTWTCLRPHVHTHPINAVSRTTVEQILGSVDAIKVHFRVTLFAAVAADVLAQEPSASLLRKPGLIWRQR
ncbi:MAG: hypothetical protein P4L90_02475 [Rhodopila sp.]|nr:hypothetical protein [Rhodopila sp.]